jgi:hypothetical protein
MAGGVVGARGTPLERFEAKVMRDPMSGCWLWAGAAMAKGYGSFGAVPGKLILAHRWAYEHFVGPIPAGLVIDHLCRNRSCVNPAHLEAVTGLENTRRGARAIATHCKHGHPFDDENTIRRANGGRDCRMCQRAADTRRRAREAIIGRFR